MKIREMKNQKDEVMKTKDGQIMTENFLEVGDQFIPQINSALEKRHEAIVDGKKKVITEYSIPITLRGKAEVIFVKLTKTQAEMINKQRSLSSQYDNKSLLPNQNIWNAYKYTNDYGEQVGIGLNKDLVEPIKF